MWSIVGCLFCLSVIHKNPPVLTRLSQIKKNKQIISFDQKQQLTNDKLKFGDERAGRAVLL